MHKRTRQMCNPASQYFCGKKTINSLICFGFLHRKLTLFQTQHCVLMSHFDKDFMKFFKDLAGNNNRDWFEANKKRYIKSVKDPFAAFVEDVLVLMKKADPRIEMQGKQAIFRIHRDVRFGKDKTPCRRSFQVYIFDFLKK